MTDLADLPPQNAASPARVVVHGAGGRMGQRIIALLHGDPRFELFGAVENSSSPHLGKDIGVIAGLGPIGVPVVDEIPEVAEVVIDFSVPEASISAVAVCSSRGTPIVVATTGHSEQQRDMLQAFSHRTAVLYSPSMSMAVNLLMKLVGTAAGVLKEHASSVDVEIIERHHRLKEDAPSGTALKFGEIIAQQMGLTRQTHGRSGRPGQRPLDEIGYHAVRTGDNPGEHTIIFGMLGETIELNVKASNRDCYARGAIEAARFLVGKKAGLYNMNDVLGL
jgi:4-hydroxy-tetrahydrodipicolinate reductase